MYSGAEYYHAACLGSKSPGSGWQWVDSTDEWLQVAVALPHEVITPSNRPSAYHSAIVWISPALAAAVLLHGDMTRNFGMELGLADFLIGAMSPAEP
jgi:hypothetical protein